MCRSLCFEHLLKATNFTEKNSEYVQDLHEALWDRNADNKSFHMCIVHF